MNLVFILLGVAVIFEGWVHLKNHCVLKIILTVFGLAIIFTAVFRHAPIESNIPFSVKDDGLHSLFATICGWSFVSFSISAAFIETSLKRKILAVAVGIIALILSILMFTVSDYMGVWQRFIFIISFAWLIFFFEAKIILRSYVNVIPLIPK